jgi:fibrillarin-like pre-rRNA processing protein
MNEVFPGVFEEGGKLFTKNLLPGSRVYGEKILQDKGIEYRQWDFFRSKLAAAIKNGLREMPIKEGSTVLYLGAAEGTTISHVSDIVGQGGLVFGIDVSERVMRKFIALCEQRKNVVPIIADAKKPWTYKEFVEGKNIDILYQDVSQPNQAQIFLKNTEYFLQKNAAGLFVVKAKSISQQTDVSSVFGKEVGAVSEKLSVRQVVNLKPFEKDHVLVLCKKI